MLPFRTVAPRLPGRPVVVVGAGPVGQTTALLLARWGVPVVLVDERPRRDPVGSKAICQARDVLDIWDTVGIGSRLAAEGVTWRTARTYYRDAEVSSWSFVDRGSSPFPPFVNIAQHRTEELLDERLAAAGALVEQRWGHRLVGIEQGARSVALRLLAGGGETVLHAAYAVVATGARSDALRTLLGVRFDGETFADRFLICDIRAELPGWERERRFYFDPGWNPGRQVLIHSCPGSVFRIDWQVPETFDLDEDERTGRLGARVRQIVGDRPFEIVWSSVYRFQSRHTDRMRVGRVLLAGDVAHLVSPFGARGLNTGVFDAENAAWKLAFVLHGWAPDALLDSYDAERMAATRENIAVTTETMRFLVPQNAGQRAERTRILDAAAADPTLAHTVESGRFAEPFWYVDSPLTTPDPARPFAGRPARGHSPAPAPGVLLPDLPVTPAGRSDVTRLRELCREGLLVLAGPGVDAAGVAAAAGGVCTAPVRSLSSAALHGDVLGVRASEVWLVRPDAHVAAIVDAAAPDALVAALRRVLALPTAEPATPE